MTVNDNDTYQELLQEYRKLSIEQTRIQAWQQEIVTDLGKLLEELDLQDINRVNQQEEVQTDIDNSTFAKAVPISSNQFIKKFTAAQVFQNIFLPSNKTGKGSQIQIIQVLLKRDSTWESQARSRTRLIDHWIKVISEG